MSILSQNIAIKAIANDISFSAANKLALQLKLPIINTDANISDYNFILEFANNCLQLKEVINKNSHPIAVDFFSNKSIHRQKHGGGYGQLIAKACGIKAHNAVNLKIIDATAGLGTDAYVLASLGCNMQMLERSPIIGALLQDALDRAMINSEFSKIKLTLTIANSVEYLQKLKSEDYPDIIYLDPMYPERKKSALGKKEMRILKQIVGEDLDAEQLLKISLMRAKKRVVVKRPKLAPNLNKQIPDLVFTGKSSRYDVYLTLM